MKSWSIPRRTFLRGAGVAMGLPLLDVMEPLAEAQSGESPFSFKNNKSSSSTSPSSSSPGGSWRAPVRMAVLYMPNGVYPSSWHPPGRGGPLNQLTTNLEPLSKLRADVLVLSGLGNKVINRATDGHIPIPAGFLTSALPTKSASEMNTNGVSMDQIAAQKIGALTPLPSLEMATESVPSGGATAGYVSAYSALMSWSSPTSPMTPENRPRSAFDRIFRTMAQGNAARFTADDKSILDKVLDDARALRSKVSSADQKKLDEYLASVRSVEVRIESEARSMAGQMAAMREARRPAVEETGRRLSGTSDGAGRVRDADITERVRIMLDLIALAFWTDQTRIATFMIGNEVSGQNFSFLPGVSGGFHDISHHGNNTDKIEQYKKINTWYVQQFAYMVDRMKQLKEGSRTLLDYSMVFFGSGLGDGNAHSHDNLPILFGGRGGGTILPGRHIAYSSGTPLANLWRSMMRRVGCPVASFADSTGELTGLEG